MNMWISLNQELIEQERWDRDREISAICRQRQLLEALGYQSPTARLRSRAAGWLLHLAVLLDNRVADGAPQRSSLGMAQR